MPGAVNIPAVVIAMTSKRFGEVLERAPLPWPFKVMQYAPAVIGSRLDLPDWWQYTPGGYGCLMSHLRVMEQAARLDTPMAVFEEDVVFCEDFAARLPEVLAGVPGGWDQLYLGGQHLTAPVPMVNPGIVRGVDVNRTHAYILAPSGARKAYKRIMERLGEGRRGGQVDYLFGDMHRDGTLAAYCPVPWLCGQAAGDSTIHTDRKGMAEKWWQL